MNGIYGCKSIGNKTCNNKSSAGAKIRRGDGSTGQSGNTFNDRDISFDLDVGTHAGKLIDIFETILENTLSNGTGTIGKSQ